MWCTELFPSLSRGKGKGSFESLLGFSLTRHLGNLSESLSKLTEAIPKTPTRFFENSSRPSRNVNNEAIVISELKRWAYLKHLSIEHSVNNPAFCVLESALEEDNTSNNTGYPPVQSCDGSVQYHSKFEMPLKTPLPFSD